LFEEQVYILKTIRNQVVQARYSTIPYSYPGIRKILKLVSRTFYLPGIKKVVEKVINSCNTCCRDKAARYIPYSKLYLLNIPPGAWKSISIDFITDLLLSKEPLTNIE
jgi:hypothetical protein